jgi:hypothetical protein
VKEAFKTSGSSPTDEGDSSPTEIKQMWPGGPLRQYSNQRPASNWIPYDGVGYVGSYVCNSCGKVTSGVYQTLEGWMCAEHRDNIQIQRLSGKNSHRRAAA